MSINLVSSGSQDIAPQTKLIALFVARSTTTFRCTPLLGLVDSGSRVMGCFSSNCSRPGLPLPCAWHDVMQQLRCHHVARQQHFGWSSRGRCCCPWTTQIGSRRRRCRVGAMQELSPQSSKRLNTLREHDLPVARRERTTSRLGQNSEGTSI